MMHFHGSSAFNTADAPTLPTDQEGVTGPQKHRIDIGAFEAVPFDHLKSILIERRLRCAISRLHYNRRGVRSLLRQATFSANGHYDYSWDNSTLNLNGESVVSDLSKIG
jgi:hypothetical protein